MGKSGSDLASRLRSAVEEAYVSEAEFVRRSYTRTPSWVQGRPPAIVVKPGSTEEVSKIVQIANETGTPVIPRGGGASVAGFPLSDRADRSILVDMTRLNRVLYLDEENMTVGAECGIILSDLADYVHRRGYHIHTVDMPQYMDTLGGALSGFNGGGEPSDLATAGEIGQYLLGLEVVLPTGDVVQTGAGPGTNIHVSRQVDRYPGSPFVTGLFIGDAGVFGIKTRAYFLISPQPRQMIYGGYECRSYEQVHKILAHLMALSPYPYSRIVSLTARGKETWSIFYGIRGSEEEVAHKQAVLHDTCLQHGALPAVTQMALETLMRFSGRQLGKWYASRGKFLYFEYLFGKSEAPAYLESQVAFVQERLKEAGLSDLVVDHVTYLIPKERHTYVLGQVYFFDENKLDPEKMEAVRNISVEESTRVLEHGGFMEANQGSLANLSASVWSPSYTGLMKTLKKALDPKNIMNPGLWRL
ncbi:MAG: FAD-binding oxidoreductase [Thermodesulfobacteriota bacterium]